MSEINEVVRQTTVVFDHLHPAHHASRHQQNVDLLSTRMKKIETLSGCGGFAVPHRATGGLNIDHHELLPCRNDSRVAHRARP